MSNVGRWRSEAVAIIIAALIGAGATLYVAKRQSAGNRDDIAEMRQRLDAQAHQIETLAASEREKIGTIENLRRSLSQGARGIETSTAPRDRRAAPLDAAEPVQSNVPSASSTEHRAMPSTIDTIVKQSFEFSQPTCAHRGDQIECAFRITNLSQERRSITLMIAGMAGDPRSFIIDSDGDRYSPVDTEVGGVGRVMFSASQPLDPDLPTKASMTFSAPEHLPSNPVAVSIRIWGESEDTVLFRGVNVQ